MKTSAEEKADVARHFDVLAFDHTSAGDKTFTVEHATSISKGWIMLQTRGVKYLRTDSMSPQQLLSVPPEELFVNLPVSDQHAFEDQLQRDDRGFYDLWRHLDSINITIEIVSVINTKVAPSRAKDAVWTNFDKILRQLTVRSGQVHIFNDPHVYVDVNQDATSPADLDDVVGSLLGGMTPANGLCCLNALASVFGPRVAGLEEQYNKLGKWPSEMTVEGLCADLRIQPGDGCKYDQLKPAIDLHGIGEVCVWHHGRVIWKYGACRKRPHLKPSRLDLVYNHEHVLVVRGHGKNSLDKRRKRLLEAQAEAEARSELQEAEDDGETCKKMVDYRVSRAVRLQPYIELASSPEELTKAIVAAMLQRVAMHKAEIAEQEAKTGKKREKPKTTYWKREQLRFVYSESPLRSEDGSTVIYKDCNLNALFDHFIRAGCIPSVGLRFKRGNIFSFRLTNRTVKGEADCVFDISVDSPTSALVAQESKQATLEEARAADLAAHVLRSRVITNANKTYYEGPVLRHLLRACLAKYLRHQLRPTSELFDSSLLARDADRLRHMFDGVNDDPMAYVHLSRKTIYRRKFDRIWGIDLKWSHASALVRFFRSVPVGTPFGCLRKFVAGEDELRLDRLYLVRVARPMVKAGSPPEIDYDEGDAFFPQRLEFIFDDVLLPLLKEEPDFGEPIAYLDLLPGREGAADAISKTIVAIHTGEGEFAAVRACDRKLVPNRVAGETGKHQLPQCSTEVFLSEELAMAYLESAGGRTYPVLVDGRPSCWVNVQSNSVDLSSGFLLINAKILDIQRYKLRCIHKRLVAADCKPLFVNTDCVFFEPPEHLREEDAAAYFTAAGIDVSDSGFGSARVVFEDPTSDKAGKRDFANHWSSRAMAREQQEHFGPIELPDLRRWEVTHTQAESYEDVAGHLSDFVGRSLVLSPAGCGKTYCAVLWAIQAFGATKVLICTPQHCLRKNLFARYIDEYPDISVTNFHTMAGVGIDNERSRRRAPMDLSPFAIVILDEVFLYSLDQLIVIRNLMRSNPSIIWLPLGDVDQLEAIGEALSNEERVHALTNMFDRVVSLSVNKRIRPEDADRLKRIQALVRQGAGIATLVGQENVTMAKLSKALLRRLVSQAHAGGHTLRALTYYKGTRSDLNEAIHAIYAEKSRSAITCKLADCSKAQPVWVGLILCCVKSNGGLRDASTCEVIVGKRGERVLDRGVSCNSLYELVGLPDPGREVYRLRDATLGHEFDVLPGTMASHFRLSYASTVHSAQGDTIRGPHIIADADSKYVDAKWLNTAFTRCTRLDHITCVSDEDQKADKRADVFFRDLARGYRKQDLDDGRDIDPSRPFVTGEFIMKLFHEQGTVCPKCCCHMVPEKSNRHAPSCQRVYNGDEAHYQDNVVIMCRHCNSSQGDRPDQEATALLGKRKAAAASAEAPRRKKAHGCFAFA
jgi:5-methylcytosine-specific restriction endonuclease McrA